MEIVLRFSVNGKIGFCRKLVEESRKLAAPLNLTDCSVHAAKRYLGGYGYPQGVLKENNSHSGQSNSAISTPSFQSIRFIAVQVCPLSREAFLESSPHKTEKRRRFTSKRISQPYMGLCE
jgi:hypothetical protein